MKVPNIPARENKNLKPVMIKKHAKLKCLMHAVKNGQTYFTTVWPFLNIIHERLNWRISVIINLQEMDSKNEQKISNVIIEVFCSSWIR